MPFSLHEWDRLPKSFTSFKFLEFCRHREFGTVSNLEKQTNLCLFSFFPRLKPVKWIGFTKFEKYPIARVKGYRSVAPLRSGPFRGVKSIFDSRKSVRRQHWRMFLLARERRPTKQSLICKVVLNWGTFLDWDIQHSLRWSVKPIKFNRVAF